MKEIRYCRTCERIGPPQRMLRAYTRPADEDGKQRLAAIGWWCPICLSFVND